MVTFSQSTLVKKITRSREQLERTGQCCECFNKAVEVLADIEYRCIVVDMFASFIEVHMTENVIEIF